MGPGQSWLKVMVQLRKISLVNDLETALVEGNTVTGIIMHTSGRHRRKSTYRNSRVGSLLPGCIDACTRIMRYRKLLTSSQ